MRKFKSVESDIKERARTTYLTRSKKDYKETL